MNRRSAACLAASLLILGASSRIAAAAVADLVLTHARLYTVSPAQPWAEAIAIKNGRIVYVGAEARERASGKR